MKKCRNIKFNSYDRLFPSQDFLQKDGFGNLIALPLQKQAREQGNSVFVDGNLKKIDDQWHYLSQIKKIPEEHVLEVCKSNKVIDTGIDSETNLYNIKIVLLIILKNPDTVSIFKLVSLLYIY